MNTLAKPATLFAIAALALAAVTLSGCGAVGTSDLSLVETKSPVQLLRNDAAGRLDSDIVSRVDATADASSACSDENENPGGLIRQWTSSANLVLVEGTDRLLAADTLIASYVDQGWEAKSMTSGDQFALTILSNPKSIATIQVAAAGESVDTVITITATGPCVLTDGPDSDEVTALEGEA
jgi:hypothetical protein